MPRACWQFRCVSRQGEDFSNQLQKLQKHFEVEAPLPRSTCLEAQDLRLHAVEDLQRRPELKDCFENFEELRLLVF